MLRNIYLHGELAAEYGEVFRIDVQTAAEAVRALCMNLPGIEVKIRENSFHVIRGDADTGMDLDIDECTAFQLGSADLHLMPVIAGSGQQKGGVLKIVLGVALIGAAFFFSGGALGAAISAGGLTGGLTYGNLAMVGVALAVSGVSSMLSPESEDSESDQSFLMSGPGTSYEQGGAIPVIYGEVITGGVMISGGFDIEQLEN